MDYSPFSEGPGLDQLPWCIVYFKIVSFTVCPLGGSLGTPKFQTYQSASIAALTSRYISTKLLHLLVTGTGNTRTIDPIAGAKAWR